MAFNMSARWRSARYTSQAAGEPPGVVEKRLGVVAKSGPVQSRLTMRNADAQRRCRGLHAGTMVPSGALSCAR
jgi:hypothetical protein